MAVLLSPFTDLDSNCVGGICILYSTENGGTVSATSVGGGVRGRLTRMLTIQWFNDLGSF